MSPAMALCPSRDANATVDRSTETNIAPRNRDMGTRTTSAGAARALRRPRRESRARPDADDAGPTGAAATTGGSVDRCDANHSDPRRAHTAAHATPAAGRTWGA